MGKKISIDSATMMNKGFEVIEAKWLFNIPYDNIEVVIHPDCYVHSMVQFKDQTIMANIGPREQQITIAYALNYPHRLSNNIKPLNLSNIGRLEFFKPDIGKFKCLKLAFDSIRLGHSYQVALNAANEICVKAFLDRKISFLDIGNTIEKIFEKHKQINLHSIEDILALDKAIKAKTQELISYASI